MEPTFADVECFVRRSLWLHAAAIGMSPNGDTGGT